MNLAKDVLLDSLSLFGLPKDRAIILMYHSILESGPFFNVTPKDFEAHMEYVAKSKRPVISLGELVRRLDAKEPLGGSVVITFDDGYRDNHEIAFPILKRHNFPATIFVVTNPKEKPGKHDLARLSIEDMKEMEASGLISIEPHSKTHPHLAKLSLQEARDEVLGSKEILERTLAKRCSFFAYPYGEYREETVSIVRSAELQGAVTVREGTVTSQSDPFRLPRVSIDSSTTLPQFRGKLTRAIDVYSAVKNSI